VVVAVVVVLVIVVNPRKSSRGRAGLWLFGALPCLSRVCSWLRLRASLVFALGCACAPRCNLLCLVRLRAWCAFAFVVRLRAWCAFAFSLGQKLPVRPRPCDGGADPRHHQHAAGRAVVSTASGGGGATVLPQAFCRLHSVAESCQCKSRLRSPLQDDATHVFFFIGL